MFEAWVTISVMAALFQTLRFMLQKLLSMGTLSPGGATFSRFFYSAPFVVLAAAGYIIWRGHGVPGTGGLFWPFALVGGLAQILATWCVVAIFSERNFAVGITFKKTEVVQTALAGFLVLGDKVSSFGMAAIIIGLVGVLFLSDSPGGEGALVRRLMNRSACLGLISGGLFAVTAVAYRGATLEVADDEAFLRAIFTLACVTTWQTIAMTAWLGWREKGEMARVWAARKTAVWIGVASIGGSLGWFTAFTLQNAAYVAAVGQIEVIFSMIVSVMFFHEKITRREYLGIALLCASIVLLILLE